MKAVAPAAVFFAAAGLVPLVVRDAFFLDGLVLILIWGASAAAWETLAARASHDRLYDAARIARLAEMKRRALVTREQKK